MASTALSASRPGPIQSSGLQGFEDQQMTIKWVRDKMRIKEYLFSYSNFSIWW